MTSILHEDRNGCAFHGAIKTLDAIKGVVPIAHANAGCSLNARFTDNAPYASIGRHFRGVLETSATTLYDKHVVFGGTARLREQIKNTIKVLNGDLYVVASGCVPEVVGDDLPAMVKEARDQRFPVIGLAVPGFHGNAYVGYDIATRGILEGIAGLFDLTGDTKPELVNVLGIVPEQDAFWEGDLLELEAVLDSVGLVANRLVGIGQDIKHWKNAGRARLTVVVSPWGLPAARFLKERFGVPYLHFGWLPVGGRDVGRLLEKIGTLIDLDEELVEVSIRRYERHTRYFLQKAAGLWGEKGLQKTVTIVAPSALAVGLTRFLSGTFGQIVAQVVLTDEPAEALRDELRTAVHEISPNTVIAFSSSQSDISDWLLRESVDIVLGSHLERKDTERLGVPLLEIASPVRQSLVLIRSHVGFSGGLELVERFSEAIFRQGDVVGRPVKAHVITSNKWHGARADNPLDATLFVA